MFKTYTMELAGRTLKVEIGRVAAQSSGAALMYYGDTVVLSTATASAKPREGIDFFPLSVDYEEKMYAVGKIPGGFLRREGRPSEHAVLTSRVIDRPMRPLFPKDYRNDVLLNNLVLCVDQDNSPEVTAMIGSSIAVSISDIPFDGPIGCCRIGLVDGELVVNPNAEQRAASDLDLTVASTAEKVIMIEAGANEVPEDIVIEAIFKAHEVNKEIVAFINTIVAECGKPKHEYTRNVLPEGMWEDILSVIPGEQMEEAVFAEQKQDRDAKIKVLAEMLSARYADEHADWLGSIDEALYQYQKKTVRKMILRDHKRPDGRAIDEIRPLTAEVDLLPRTHGSAMFKRGQTQIMDICTLAPLSDSQKIDSIDTSVTRKRYMHQYNFPSYSVGETKPNRSPGRREIGHGALAERALLPVLPSEEEFPYAIRCVSETFESNGSTSQASVCASSMALMAAGVPTKAAVAGISCGLVTGETEDDYIVLTDIQGVEDFFGDMDFKVAGTHKGITAIQMDIKIHGLTEAIIREAIAKTKIARTYILDEVMAKAISEPRPELSPYAPKIEQISIDPAKIGEVVGKKGKVINSIIEETGCQIDIEDDGSVSVAGTDPEMIQKAIRIIESIVNDAEPGQIFTGKVVRIMDFGAFVEIAPNKDGLVRVSKLADHYVEKVEDVVNIGDEVTVKVLEIDSMGRINLTMNLNEEPGSGDNERRSGSRDRNRDRGGDRNRDRNRSGDRNRGGDRNRDRRHSDHKNRPE